MTLPAAPGISEKFLQGMSTIWEQDPGVIPQTVRFPLSPLSIKERRAMHALWRAGIPSVPLTQYEEKQQIQVLRTLCGCRPEQLVQTAQLLLFFAKGLIAPIDDQGAESNQSKIGWSEAAGSQP